MKLTSKVSLVGSGDLGFGLTHDRDCNVYLLDGGGQLALVDAGAGIDPSGIIRCIEDAGYDPGRVAHLFLTHGHADHAGGARQLRDRLQCRVWASAVEADMLRKGDERGLGLEAAKKSGLYPGDYRLEETPVDEELGDGDEVRVGSCVVRVIGTPGHSSGSVCYLAITDSGEMLFTGDTLLAGGRMALLNCPGFNLDDLRRSVVSKLDGLCPSAVFPGHGTSRLTAGAKWIEQAVVSWSSIRLPPSIV